MPCHGETSPSPQPIQWLQQPSKGAPYLWCHGKRRLPAWKGIVYPYLLWQSRIRILGECCTTRSSSANRQQKISLCIDEGIMGYTLMIRRKFGWTRIEVPIIGQGTWLTDSGGGIGRKDNSLAVKALQTSLELRMNHIDTVEIGQIFNLPPLGGSSGNTLQMYQKGDTNRNTIVSYSSPIQLTKDDCVRVIGISQPLFELRKLIVQNHLSQPKRLLMWTQHRKITA